MRPCLQSLSRPASSHSHSTQRVGLGRLLPPLCTEEDTEDTLCAPPPPDTILLQPWPPLRVPSAGLGVALPFTSPSLLLSPLSGFSVSQWVDLHEIRQKTPCSTKHAVGTHAPWAASLPGLLPGLPLRPRSGVT